MAQEIPQLKSGLGAVARTHLEVGMPEGLQEVPEYLENEGYDVVDEKGWGDQDSLLRVYTIEINAEEEAVEEAELDNPDATNTYGLVMEYSPNPDEGMKDYFFTSSVQEAFEEAENIVPIWAPSPRH
ncbi:MAG: hypothetical protein ABEI13_01080 [Candidatus Paceibacteria bacterium]